MMEEAEFAYQLENFFFFSIKNSLIKLNDAKNKQKIFKTDLNRIREGTGKRN